MPRSTLASAAARGREDRSRAAAEGGGSDHGHGAEGCGDCHRPLLRPRAGAAPRERRRSEVCDPEPRAATPRPPPRQGLFTLTDARPGIDAHRSSRERGASGYGGNRASRPQGGRQDRHGSMRARHERLEDAPFPGPPSLSFDRTGFTRATPFSGMKRACRRRGSGFPARALAATAVPNVHDRIRRTLSPRAAASSSGGGGGGGDSRRRGRSRRSARGRAPGRRG